MGILDDLFAQNTAQPQQGNATPAALPAQPAPALPTNYGDYIRQLLAATNANIDAEKPLSQRGLLNLFTGADREAAIANTVAGAPAAWQQFLQAQSATRNAQLGTASSLAQQGALANNTPIDPNNIDASIPAMQAAMVGGGGASAPGGDPLQQQRALYNRLGTMFSRNPATVAVAKDFFALRDKGLPDGAAVLPDGSVVDGSNGTPITQTVGALLATRKGQEAAADANARLPATLASQTHQGNVDVGVHTANANTDAAHDLVNGLDPRTGQPVTRTRADILANGNFISSNPYFDGQQAELKDLRTKAESADQGLNLATQISNAANGIYTGKGAGAMQNARKLAQLAGDLTGADTSKVLDQSTSQFEQLKFASQQLVAVASHDLSPRVAMNIYNQIAAVKPGDQTSVRGLRDIINKELLPVFQRIKALYGATSRYYQKNPLTNDAAAHVSDANPIANFGVKDVHSAQPGDYFIDPSSGNLRQRPLQ